MQTALDTKLADSPLDPDTALAANSDSLIPTQKAVKAYVDANSGEASNYTLAYTHVGYEQARGAGITNIDTVGFATVGVNSTVAATLAFTNPFTAMSRVLHQSASAGAVCGRYGNGTNLTRGDGVKKGGFRVVIRFGINSGASTLKILAGLRGGTGAPSDVEPSSLTDIIIFGADSTDTNLQLMHNDSSGTATKIDLGSDFPAGNRAVDILEAEFWCDPNDSSVNVKLTRTNSSGTVFTYTNSLSSDIPSTTTWLNPNCWCVATAAGLRELAYSRIYIEKPF